MPNSSALPVLVVVRFAKSDQYRRAYRVSLRLGIVNAYSRRSPDGSVRLLWTVSYQVCSRTHPIPW